MNKANEAAKPDASAVREMLRAMQAGELTVSRGIELLDMWLAGNYSDDLLPPVRQDLIEEDSMPVEIIDRLKAELADRASPEMVFTLKAAIRQLTDELAELRAQEPVAWCDDPVLAGGIGNCASASAKRYWERGSVADRFSAERLKNPLFTRPIPAAQAVPVEFGMSGQRMHFKIGNQRFDLAYEPEEQAEFDFMAGMILKAIGRTSAQAVPDGLVELLKAIRPEYGAVGSRDIDVGRQQKQIDAAIAMLAAAPQPTADAMPEEPVLMSRHSRAMLLNVLWHHQGGSSEVGQPLRGILGIGQHDHLNDEQLAEAKWIDRLLAPLGIVELLPAPKGDAK